MDIEDINNTDIQIPNELKIKIFVKKLIEEIGLDKYNPTDKQVIDLFIILKKKYKISPTKNNIRYIYEKYFMNEFPKLNHIMGRFMIKKAMRSRSGVLVSTITLKPDKFSCPKKCSYCPTETDLQGNPTQPKSYLSTEPAMLRALQYNFDVKLQLWDRINAYIKTGNISNNNSNITKIQNHSYKFEMILSGGTWESYSYEYRNQVIHEIYYGANTFSNKRDILSLDEEIKINETALYRIIGLTIETRPDFITKQSIKDYRRWGATRIQIGVQHYNDDILEKINRECYTKDTIRAIKLLKQNGFKVVCHLMPDLPGSSPLLDKWMFNEAINNPDLQFDDVKIYPTAICKSEDKNLIVSSDILNWYNEGTYIPYADTNIQDLIDVLKEYKNNIQPWVRIQRLVRDIPSNSMEAGYKKISNLRQIITNQMKKDGTKCKCIRCMEVGNQNELMNNSKVVVRKYTASEGDEYYISIESNKKTYKLHYKYMIFLIKYYFYLFTQYKYIYWEGDIETYNGLIGFCRLRLNKHIGEYVLPEIQGCALIREVHVYGYSVGVGGTSNDLKSSQHKGFGKLLVKTAEIIAYQNNYNKIAIIAGVGTREYYKNKCGYYLDGTYMKKIINNNNLNFDKFIILILSFFIFSLSLYYTMF